MGPQAQQSPLQQPVDVGNSPRLNSAEGQQPQAMVSVPQVAYQGHEGHSQPGMHGTYTAPFMFPTEYSHLQTVPGYPMFAQPLEGFPAHTPYYQASAWPGHDMYGPGGYPLGFPVVVPPGSGDPQMMQPHFYYQHPMVPMASFPVAANTCTNESGRDKNSKNTQLEPQPQQQSSSE